MTKRSKKLLSLAASLMAAASLIGCGGAGSGSQTGAKEPSGNISAGPRTGTLTVSASSTTEISDTLFGLFLEDINFAVDGGMYAELIKNRSFEYGAKAANQNRHGWVLSDSDALTFTVADGSADESALHDANPHYAVLTNQSTNYAGIGNVGYLDGLAVTGGTVYDASLYIKGNNSYSGSVRLSLRDSSDAIYAETLIDGISDEWRQYTATLTPSTSINKDLRLFVEITEGSVNLDMVSLMPRETYKGLPIRKDIGEYMEALNPSFLRFPGGCVIEGSSEASMYSWKDSIGNGMNFERNGVVTVGDIAVRPQGVDIWGGTNLHPYYTTYGIGFYEYFMLCEALDCLPVPVLNAGMTCEVQSPNYIVYSLNSAEFAQCIQDALDLVEFCRGDASTYWGSVRIAMGHEDPFSLKYIAIGNEQWQSEYHAHYAKFEEAFEAAAGQDPSLYADIELIVANGTSSASREGWNYVDGFSLPVTTLVDEHYYEAPNWFLSNTLRYDSYDRTLNAKVFLGEYAAQSNTLSAALAEAAYMTALERNGDVVAMACYAPLFGNGTANQWTPDMMFFSNDGLYGTADYYVQKLFANNTGTAYLSNELSVTEADESEAFMGAVGLGSWCTSVAYDNLTVTSNATGEVLYATDFEDSNVLRNDDWDENEGDWSIKDGRLIQTNTGNPANANTGDSVYVGDNTWQDYTLCVDAEILSGAEGFLIPVCVENTANNIFWNLGGWGNTVSCLQIVDGNAKSGQVSGTTRSVTLNKGQVYHLKVVVTADNIKCYLDDSLYIDYSLASTPTFFASSVMDESGDLIVKYVNYASTPVTMTCTFDGFDFSGYSRTATVHTLSGTDLSLVNTKKEPTLIAPTESTAVVSESFDYEVPGYALVVIRISKK